MFVLIYETYQKEPCRSTEQANSKDILTAKGEPAQGCLAWLLAKSPITIPIPDLEILNKLKKIAKFSH